MTNFLTILLTTIVLCCCSSKDKDGTHGNAASAQRDDAIGPQFWKTDLSEYEKVDQNIEYGMGGRWISVRFKKKDKSNVTKAVLEKRFKKTLASDGWILSGVPKRKYVLSKIWETSKQDLYFSRKNRASEPEDWFFHMAVHISNDANYVVLYCEVGW